MAAKRDHSRQLVLDLANLTHEQVTKAASNVAAAIIIRMGCIVSPVDEYGAKKADNDLPDGKELHSISIALKNAWQSYSDINKLNELKEEESSVEWIIIKNQ